MLAINDLDCGKNLLRMYTRNFLGNEANAADYIYGEQAYNAVVHIEAIIEQLRQEYDELMETEHPERFFLMVNGQLEEVSKEDYEASHVD